MKWDDFLNTVGDLPVINTEVLVIGVTNPGVVKVQLSRWRRAGKLIQLKKGFYVLAQAYRKIDIYELYVASLLKRPSYISLEKALEFYGLIPEAVPIYTSVTPKRQGKFISKIGIFEYQHIKDSLFWGYDSISMNKQTAFIASPEKALLDLIYFKGMNISLGYLEGLRLQNVEKININKLFIYAEKFKKRGMLFAADVINKYCDCLKKEEEIL